MALGGTNTRGWETGSIFLGKKGNYADKQNFPLMVSVSSLNGAKLFRGCLWLHFPACLKKKINQTWFSKNKHMKGKEVFTF